MARKLFLICALLGVLFGCDVENTGRVRAPAIGALADVPAPRGVFDEQLREACDREQDGGAGPSVARAPYLQSVTASSALLLWTSEGAAAPQRVELSTPDGSFRREYDAVLDPSASTAGARQFVARLHGLEARRVYCYSLVGEHGARTPPAGFRTAPSKQSGEAIAFAVFGDGGTGTADQRAVVRQLESVVPLDLVLVTGDVAYESGTLRQYEEHFFVPYEHLLRSVPFFPVAGNHDYQTAGGAPFREVFALPENGAPEGRERWYSFDWGEVHFAAIDTERIGDAQAAWLDADLAHTDKRWKIVFTHKSPYASGAHGSNLAFRHFFVPLLRKHGVQLVFAGHDHSYERSRAIDGVTYVVTGGGGRSTRGVGRSWFTAFSTEVLHFVYVRVEGSQLRLYAIDATGQEFDFLHLTNASSPRL